MHLNAFNRFKTGKNKTTKSPTKSTKSKPKSPTKSTKPKPKSPTKIKKTTKITKITKQPNQNDEEFGKQILKKQKKAISLDLSGNNLASLPSMNKMKQLKGLNLCNNNFQSFPNEVFTIPNLIKLKINNVPINPEIQQKLLESKIKIIELNGDLYEVNREQKTINPKEKTRNSHPNYPNSGNISRQGIGFGNDQMNPEFSINIDSRRHPRIGHETRYQERDDLDENYYGNSGMDQQMIYGMDQQMIYGMDQQMIYGMDQQIYPKMNQQIYPFNNFDNNSNQSPNFYPNQMKETENIEESVLKKLDLYNYVTKENKEEISTKTKQERITEMIGVLKDQFHLDIDKIAKVEIIEK
ncbi:leucine-rich repeat-containing protein [Anaeramoeba ignava]|uniref:Leucine-rich repeat-containing protein n=1 Tax=Anaeramoeba ignava TaxID=1746090 RepID=A0A9Q0LQL2_ANAIG|nr:leucine-rich repeat-containing protein [Anaeramoeba ignava]